MLTLNEFSHNHHPSGMKMVAKNIRCGISIIFILSNASAVIFIASLRP
jgi:hypothetical protein